MFAQHGQNRRCIMCIGLRNVPRLIAAGLLLGVYATPAAALPLPNLHVGADGFIGGFANQVQDATTGPIQANDESGVVLAYRYPGHFPDWELETTLYARGQARADYGTNGAAVELDLRPVNGTDRGAYPSSDYYGVAVPDNSATAQSTWTDTFLILGGTGLGEASVSVALHGHAETRYGANGTIWYDAEPSFETFGTSGEGFAQYRLKVLYDAPPTGAPPDYFRREEGLYKEPINRGEGWGGHLRPPIPAFVVEIGVQPDILTGSFLFEYGVPFAVSSDLFVRGTNQIYIDFDHTATLSLFELPVGASLTSGSGHIYPVSSIPEPSTWAITSCALVLVAAVHGVRRRQRRDSATGDGSDIRCVARQKRKIN